MTDLGRLITVVLSVASCYASRPMALPFRIGAAVFVAVAAFVVARDRS